MAPWTSPRLILIASGQTAHEGVRPGITEHGHIRGNSNIHMEGNTTPTIAVGTATSGVS